MLAKIALLTILGKPLIVYLGAITLIALIVTAIFGILIIKGIFKLPIRWHIWLARLTVVLAIIHGIFGLSIYFGF